MKHNLGTFQGKNNILSPIVHARADMASFILLMGGTVIALCAVVFG